MATRTKIICTIGPSVDTLEKMRALMEAGMNCARLNFSHGTHEQHAASIQNLKEARKRLNIPLAIMLDTKGPEIRLGTIQGGELRLIPGQEWFLVKEVLEGNHEKVTINPGSVLDVVSEGTRILFDDGYISSHVIKLTPEGVLVKIDNGGLIKTGKGVNIPNVNLNLPGVTARDVEDIRFGCRQNVDIIAASFIRSAEHILQIKKILDEEKKPEIQVFAKIENSEGVLNFDSILQAADGIMVARGDLGVELPLSHVPKLQKMMIQKCYMAGKHVVTATQMLESMINNPRPTRAEVSDVANAIYDSTSSVMLSGETAVGKYPLEAVNVMRSIVKETETDFDYHTFFNQHSARIYHDVPSAVTLATVKTAYSSDAQAIFAFTSSGLTARLLSRLRPEMMIVAMTPNEKSYHQMALSWGVTPVLSVQHASIKEAFESLSQYALERSLVSYGDLVIVTAGSPFGVSGTTNMMLVESIGDVLVRGYKGLGKPVYGNVIFAFSADLKKPYMIREQLLVITKCDEAYLPLIKESIGVILQNDITDTDSENYLLKVAQELNKSVIVRADAATRMLKEGQLVSLDPERALIYKGAVV